MIIFILVEFQRIPFSLPQVYLSESKCIFMHVPLLFKNLLSQVKQHRIETSPFRGRCGLRKREGPVLLHIHFADLLASQFIAFNSLAPQQLLLFCCISNFQLGEVGRGGDEIIVPIQIPQVDEHVHGISQN